jgi:pentapeptide MXKDX repeat protein
MNKKVLSIIVVVLLVIAGFFAFTQLGGQDQMAETSEDKAMMDESKEEMKDEEMKDEEMKDEEMKDEAMEKESMEEQMTNNGVPAPTFALMNASGDTVDLASLEGEKVYVKFWASWCSVCLAGLEDLNELSADNENFRVITIVSPEINGEQSKEDFITWFDSLGYDNIEVLFDETGDLVKAYGIRAYPTSAYIGSDGVLVKVQPGHMTNDMVRSFFEGVY